MVVNYAICGASSNDSRDEGIGEDEKILVLFGVVCTPCHVFLDGNFVFYPFIYRGWGGGHYLSDEFKTLDDYQQ